MCINCIQPVYHFFNQIASPLSNFAVHCKYLTDNLFDQFKYKVLQNYTNLRHYTWCVLNTPSVTPKIFNLSGPQVPSLGDNSNLSEDVLLHHVLPYLSAKDAQGLLRTCKTSLRLLNQPGVADRLSTDLRIKFLKLAFVAGPSLTQLDLSCCQLPEEEFISLFQKCPNLTHINLANTHISNKAVAALLQSCSKLTHLNLEQFSGLTSQAIQTIIQHGKHLKSLNLSNFIWEIKNEDVQALAEHLPGLTELNLCNYYERRLTDIAIQTLAQRCHSLEKLNLWGCQMTDASLEALAKHCPKLTDLNISSCGRLTGPGLEALAKSLPNLTTLDICLGDQMTDRVIQTIAQNCRNLKSIHLGSCKKITDEAIEALAQVCPNLEVLNLSDCEHLTQRALHALAQHCPKLTKLALTNSGITDSDFQAVAGNWPHLTSLCLGKSQNLTEATIQDMAQRYPKLTSIDLCESTITDAFLQALAQHYPHLKYLRLSKCEGITDEAIQSLAEYCPQIETLDLGCTKIKDIAVQTINRSFPNLKRISLGNCENIRDGGLLYELTQKRPRMQFIGLLSLRHDWYFINVASRTLWQRIYAFCRTLLTNLGFRT